VCLAVFAAAAPSLPAGKSLSSGTPATGSVAPRGGAAVVPAAGAKNLSSTGGAKKTSKKDVESSDREAATGKAGSRASVINESDDALHLYVSTPRAALVADDVAVVPHSGAAAPGKEPVLYTADETEGFTPFYVASVWPNTTAEAGRPTVLLHRPFVFFPPQSLRVSLPGWGAQFTKHVPSTVLAKAAPAAATAAAAASAGKGKGGKPASAASKLTPAEEAAADPLAFTLEYQCLQKGEFTVRVNLRFVIDDAAAILANTDITPPAARAPGSGAVADGEDSVVKDIFSRRNKRFHHVPLQFTKRCTEVDLSEHRSAVPGFRVATHLVSAVGSSASASTGSVSGTEAAALVDGEPTPEFLLSTATDGTEGPVPMFTLPASELVLPFTATYTAPSAAAAAALDMLPVMALAHEPAGVDVHVIGRASKKTILGDRAAGARFSVRADCLQVGSWLVTVTFAFEDLGAVAPKFTFVKACDAAAVAAAEAAAAAAASSGTGADADADADAGAAGASIVEGLAVSTQPLTTADARGDIAHDGHVRLRYATVAAAAAETGRARLTLPATQNTVTFYVDNTLPGSAPRAGALLIDAVAVMTYPRGIAVPAVKDVFEWTALELMPDFPPRPLTVTLTCLAAGTAQVVVHLAADDDVVFVFRKECDGPAAAAAALVSGGNGGDRVVPSDASSSSSSSSIPAGTPPMAPGPLAANEDLLPGLVVALTTSPQDIDSIAVHHGVSHTDFNPHLAQPERALRVPASQHFLTFFVLVIKPQNEAEAALYKPVRFGRPLLTTTYAVADPALSGYGSEGATLTSGDQTYSLISLTFHCQRPGTTSVMVSLPLLPVDAATTNAAGSGANNSTTVAHRAHEHVTFFVEKNCFTADSASSSGDNAADTRYSSSGMGGIGLPGLSIGLSASTHEVVRDGFPTNLYYAQRTREAPQWGPAIVGTESHSMTVYLHYALPQYATVDPDELLIPGAISFSAPSVIAHSSAARPALSGDASAGGVLTFKGAPLELDITFNCQYAELVPVTVTLPIEPRGSIVFTVPKQCGGRDAPRGKTVPGVQVAALTLSCHDVFVADEEDAAPPTPAGLVTVGGGSGSTASGDAFTSESGETVLTSAKTGRKRRCKYTPAMAAKDGVIKDEFSATVTTRKERFLVDASTSKTPFFIRRVPQAGAGKDSVVPLFGTEPMVFAHRPICRPSLVHNLNFDVDGYLKRLDDAAAAAADSASASASADALAAVVRTLDTVPITIDSVLRSFNITYHCTWVGRTAVTVTLPIYPDTPISLYFYKECPDVVGATLGDRIHVDGAGSAGVLEPGWTGHDEANPSVPVAPMPSLIDTATSAAGTATGTGATGAAAAGDYGVSPYDRNLVGYIDVGTDRSSFDGRANVVFRGVPRAVYFAFRAPDADADADEDGFKDRPVDYPGALEERLKLNPAFAAAHKAELEAKAAAEEAQAAAAAAAAAATAAPGTSTGAAPDAGAVAAASAAAAAAAAQASATASALASAVKTKLSSWAAWLQTTAPPRPGLGRDPLEAEEESLLANIDPDEEYAIIPPSQKSSRFYFSLPPLANASASPATAAGAGAGAKTAAGGALASPFQPFAAPYAKTLHNAYGQQIVDIRLSGPAASGGNLTATVGGRRAAAIKGSPLSQLTAGAAYVDVEYKCLRPGYTSVLVAVPLVPVSLGQVSWRVVKLCSGVRPKRGGFLARLLSFRGLVWLAVVVLPLLVLLGYAALYSDKGRRAVQVLGLARLSVALGFDDGEGSLANGLDELPRTGLYSGIGSSENVYNGFNTNNSIYDDESSVEMTLTSDISRAKKSSSSSATGAVSGTPGKAALGGKAGSGAGGAGAGKRVTFADERSPAKPTSAELASAAAALGTAPVGDIDAELEELLNE
jgi:hypothetical protein